MNGDGALEPSGVAWRKRLPSPETSYNVTDNVSNPRGNNGRGTLGLGMAKTALIVPILRETC
jgi:hypothetical protein